MEIQELCKLGFRCVLSSSQWRYRNSANSGSGVYCRVVSGDTGTLQTRGSGVYCRVDSRDTGTLQTRVQVCIVE